MSADREKWEREKAPWHNPVIAVDDSESESDDTADSESDWGPRWKGGESSKDS